MTKQSNYQWKLPDIKDNYDEIVIDIVETLIVVNLHYVAYYLTH